MTTSSCHNSTRAEGMDEQFVLFDKEMRAVWVERSRLEHRTDSLHSELRGESIYVASRTIHADKWRQMRDAGLPITCTWIDEAGVGQSKDLSDLADRCIKEAANSSAFILYCEQSDQLKGALMECGAALANNVQVFCVGDCLSISKVFSRHPLWHSCATLDQALNLIAESSCLK